MSEQVESKATDAVEEVVDATVETVAEIEDAVEAEVADVVAEADAVEAEAEEAVAEAVAEAAAIEEAVEEAAAELVEEAADAGDDAVAEIVAEAAAIEEAVEENVADVIAEADAVEAEAEEAVAEVVAEAVAVEEAVEEAAADVIAEAVEEAVVAEETVEEAVAEAAADVVAEAAEVEEAAEEAVAEVVAETATAEETAEVVAAADAAADTEEDDGSGRVVRVLSVGMEIDGVVKRITEFGAFVDIGVGRDGLVHISEMSVRRVAKVSDVLKEGQEIKAWIKQLDRDRNRISLTLIAPGVVTIRDLEKGDLVNGTVTRIVPYGAFVDIGVGRDALLHIREMAEGYVKRPEDVVQVGEELEARIIDLSKRRGRIDLSIKGLRPEPVADVVEEEAAGADEVEGEEELEDPFADVEVLSPIELAFQKAMAENEDDVTGLRKKKGKRARRAEQRAIQDEIISRTLEGRN